MRRHVQAPEHNIIQNPEMLRALQTALGIRQMHTVPTLNEGVQPVVVIGDVSKALTSPVRTGIGSIESNGGGGFYLHRFLNPSTSRKRIRMERLRVHSITSAATVRMSVCLGSIVGFTTDWGAVDTFGIGFDESTVGQTPSTLAPRRLAGTTSAGVHFGFATQVGAQPEVNVGTLLRFPLPAAPAVVILELGGIVLDPGFAIGIQNLATLNPVSMVVTWEWSEEEMTS